MSLNAPRSLNVSNASYQFPAEMTWYCFVKLFKMEGQGSDMGMPAAFRWKIKNYKLKKVNNLWEKLRNMSWQNLRLMAKWEGASSWWYYNVQWQSGAPDMRLIHIQQKMCQWRYKLNHLSGAGCTELSGIFCSKDVPEAWLRHGLCRWRIGLWEGFILFSTTIMM